MNDRALYDRQGRPRTPMLAPETVSLALLLVSVLGLVVRLFHLGAESFWVDELITLRQGWMPGHGLLEQFLDDVQSPLPMVVATVMSTVSTNEFWLRLPSALLGALSIPLLYEVARRFTGERAALVAALLLALNPMHLDHSQEVRGYAYLIFFGLAATGAALDAGARPGWRASLAVFVCGVGAGLSNLQGLFWMGGLALGLLVSRRYDLGALGRWALIFLAILAVLSPWWAQSLGIHETDRLVPGEDTGQLLRGSTTWSQWSLPYAGFVLAMGRTLGPSTAELYAATSSGQAATLPAASMPVAGLVAALVLAVGTMGILRLRRHSPEILSWAFFAVLFAVLLAVRNVKPFNPRYVIAALPVLLIFCAAGIDGLGRRGGVVALGLWLALTGVSLGHYWFDPDYAHEDVRGAAELVGEREGNDDMVLVGTVARVFEHYFSGRSPVRPAPIDASEAAARLDDFEPNRRYLWYVRSRPWFSDPEGLLLDALETRYRRQSRFELPGVDLRLYDRGPRAQREGSSN